MQVLIKTNIGGLWNDRMYGPTSTINTVRLPTFAFDVARVLSAGKSA